ncbi:methyltransferase domain-containing protein [Trichlorobacter sp.]|uniref:methyltransferase domain-containing protein n=1 Tax=Trichlorobacter sp. TaxID=2911007 RepID=UPI002A3589FA|nr:methyltransferase domain-containing protein [Trichlorobacter sp.]MDY0383104.1 methyltransferase domain-containing protein [Trichlorobacter sp.]
MTVGKKKAAVFLCYYSIGKSSPVICLLEMLCDYYCVDLHLCSVGHLNASVMQRVHQVVQYPPDIDITMLQENRSLFYDYFIALDANGFVLSKTLFPASRPVYYSLELYFRNNAFNLHYPERIMEHERRQINSIKGLIIQSEERESLFRNEYGLSPEIPTLLLPITYMQPSSRERSDYLRRKFNIPHNQKIAIHLGGIQEQHCLLEIAAAFHDVQDWALVMHGNAYGDYKKYLELFVRRHSISNVHISDDYVEQIEDLDVIVKSADVGIAWYKNVSPNFTSAGKSSGKISAYLRFGLPVLANRYRSTVEAIEGRGCGVCVDNFEQIPTALRNLSASYRYYSNNSFREYDNVYWFENHRTALRSFIELEQAARPGLQESNPDFVDPVLSADTIDIYWIRKSIVTALKGYLERASGLVLDVGCGRMPYKTLISSYDGITGYIGLDIENPGYQTHSKPDLFWDGVRIPLADNSVDCVIATELFEHVPDLEAMLREIKRVLRPGGSIFFTVPFLWPLHDMPQDECRYTPFSLRKIFERAGYSDTTISALGGWDASLAQMLGLWIKRRPMEDNQRSRFIELWFPFYQELLRAEQNIPVLDYDGMSRQSVMITGLYGVAVSG